MAKEYHFKFAVIPGVSLVALRGGGGGVLEPPFESKLFNFHGEF